MLQLGFLSLAGIVERCASSNSIHSSSVLRREKFVANEEQRVVGIDLGTTNSLVAYMEGDTPVVIPGEDGSPIVPSVVAFPKDGEAVVGNPARDLLIQST